MRLFQGKMLLEEELDLVDGFLASDGWQRRFGSTWCVMTAPDIGPEVIMAYLKNRRRAILHQIGEQEALDG